MDSNTRGATWCPSSCVSTCVCAWRICATRAHVLRVVVERMNGQRHQFQVLDSDAACVGVCRSTDRQNDGSTRRGRRHRQLPGADSGSGGTLCRPCGKARGALLGSLGTFRQVTSKLRLDSLSGRRCGQKWSQRAQFGHFGGLAADIGKSRLRRPSR